MATESIGSEKAIGTGILLSLIAIGGALLMYLDAGDPLAGWGFAVAMLAGSLAVVAVQLW
ncbi:MAG: hypothetical protein ABEH88_05580 [Halobacteriales archaeon]